MAAPQAELIRLLRVKVLANNAIEQGEGFRLELLPRVAIGAVGGHLKDSPQSREDFVQRILERQLMTSQNQQSHFREKQRTVPREVLWTLPIRIDEKRTRQRRPDLRQ